MAVVTRNVGVNIALNLLNEGKRFKLDIRVLENDAMRSSIRRGIDRDGTTSNNGSRTTR
jgi:hypothetical protein